IDSALRRAESGKTCCGRGSHPMSASEGVNTAVPPTDRILALSRCMRPSGRVGARSRAPGWPGILLGIAFISFGAVTIVEEFTRVESAEPDWRLAAVRFLIHPLFLGAWLVLRRRYGPRVRCSLDGAGVPAVLLGLWFAMGASVAEDSVASLGRAIPVLLMISGAFCIVGPTLASPRGAGLLFRAALNASLLLSIWAVVGVFIGYHPLWGLLGERFMGPLNATTLGPICGTGLLAALAVWKLSTSRYR